MLLARGVALWDVIEECDIIGSSDSSIRNVIPVDIMAVLSAADIRAIYCNGARVYSLHALSRAAVRPHAREAAVHEPGQRPRGRWSAFTASGGRYAPPLTDPRRVLMAALSIPGKNYRRAARFQAARRFSYFLLLSPPRVSIISRRS